MSSALVDLTSASEAICLDDNETGSLGDERGLAYKSRVSSPCNSIKGIQADDLKPKPSMRLNAAALASEAICLDDNVTGSLGDERGLAHNTQSRVSSPCNSIKGIQADDLKPKPSMRLNAAALASEAICLDDNVTGSLGDERGLAHNTQSRVSSPCNSIKGIQADDLKTMPSMRLNAAALVENPNEDDKGSLVGPS